MFTYSLFIMPGIVYCSEACAFTCLIHAWFKQSIPISSNSIKSNFVKPNMCTIRAWLKVKFIGVCVSSCKAREYLHCLSVMVASLSVYIKI